MRNSSGDVDGDLLTKVVAEYVGIGLIVFSALAESFDFAKPVSLEWIGALLGLGAKGSWAYSVKRKQDRQSDVEKHRASSEADAIRSRAVSVTQTLRPNDRAPVVPTAAPIPEVDLR